MEKVRDDISGFTLLELLLVVTILSAVAWMSLGVVTNNNDQIRFEDTRNRLQAIRRAIIGDTSRTVNGGPEIRGYVADMGRLPQSLQALIAQDYCPGEPDKTTSATCSGTMVEQPSVSIDSSTGLKIGWNGPYLKHETLRVADYPKFPDGWGNSSSTTNNFGWGFQFPYTDPTDGQVHLLVKSLGRDGAVGGSEYDADYPDITLPGVQPQPGERLISDGEYRVLITNSGTAAQGDGVGGITINFGAPNSCWVCSGDPATNITRSACESAGYKWRPVQAAVDSATCTSGSGVWQPTENLCLAVAYRNGSLTTPFVSVIHSYDAESVTWDGTQIALSFVFEDETAPTYDENTYLPMGTAALRIYQLLSATSCSLETIPAGAEYWQHFLVIPGVSISPIPVSVQ